MVHEGMKQLGDEAELRESRGSICHIQQAVLKSIHSFCPRRASFSFDCFSYVADSWPGSESLYEKEMDCFVLINDTQIA